MGTKDDLRRFDISIVAYCPLVFGFTWLIERKRTAHFIVVDDVSVPAEKKSNMML